MYSLTDIFTKLDAPLKALVLDGLRAFSIVFVVVVAVRIFKRIVR